MNITLANYDAVIINTSGGKDSLCSIWEICRLAEAQGYPKERIALSHQELGRMEWPGTKELVLKHAELFGLQVYFSRRMSNGQEDTILDYVARRGQWPSSAARFCTSEFKRAPGAKVVRNLATKGNWKSILHVFGFRAEESPARAKRAPLAINERLTTKGREVFDYLPIHDWTLDKVWQTIRENNLPYHYAYDLGMPRLSCVFCIFSPADALIIAGMNNPELLDEYIATEQAIGHDFKKNYRLQAVRDAIAAGYVPANIQDWKM